MEDEIEPGIQPGDFVEIDTGTVHRLTAIDDNGYVMIKTIDGSIWIPITRVIRRWE